MSAFDDLLEEIEGTGWYQKRLVYYLLAPLFFFMPFAFLCQIFVLYIPGKIIHFLTRRALSVQVWTALHACFFLDHWCTPPEGFDPQTLNISLETWKSLFLPQELGPDFQV